MQEAHSAVAKALRDGRLTRQPCEDADGTCKGRVHAHHDDYARPLDVRWLCQRHHRLWHAENGPGANKPKTGFVRITVAMSPLGYEMLVAAAAKARRSVTSEAGLRIEQGLELRREARA